MRLLSVECDPDGARLVRELLGGGEAPALDVTSVTGIELAPQALERDGYDAVLLPLAAPASSERSPLEGVLAIAGDVPVIVVADADLGAATVAAGAAGYVTPSARDHAGLVNAVRSVIERERRARVERRAPAADAAYGSWYGSLFEHSLDGILLTTPRGEILAANPAMCQMLGYSEDELRTLGRAGVVDLTDPRLPGALAERQRTGRFVGELTFIAKDGRRVPVELSSRVFMDAEGRELTSMFVHDVTERRRTEESLRRSEDRFRIALKGSPIIVSTVDRELRYTWIYNPSLFRPEEVLGKRDDELVPGEHVAELMAMKREVLATEQGVRRELWIGVGGEDRFYIVTAEPLRDDTGAVVGLTVAAMDITERKQMEMLLQRLSTTDALTSLQNRRGFFELARLEAAVAHRGGRDLLVFYMDVDDFKRINDSFGHQEGDRLLQQVADLIRQVFRATDVSARLGAEGGVVGRLGGDEFVVLAIDTEAGAEEALRERLAEAVRQHNETAGLPYALSLSVGVARWAAGDDASLDEILARADQRMYEHKRRSRA